MATRTLSSMEKGSCGMSNIMSLDVGMFLFVTGDNGVFVATCFGFLET